MKSIVCITDVETKPTFCSNGFTVSITYSNYNSVMRDAILVNFYSLRILGVLPTATDEEIKRKYRDMAKVVHPDKVTNLPVSFLYIWSKYLNHSP